VLKANKNTNVGGHISTFASAATLYEVGFNHFFRGHSATHPGDVVFFQGHASPALCACLRGRPPRRAAAHELSPGMQPGGGLSSYPHPWLMPEFWQYPTVSMVSGRIKHLPCQVQTATLRDRGLAKTDEVRVWAFWVTANAMNPKPRCHRRRLAARSSTTSPGVINCNLQRLDGPVAATANHSRTRRQFPRRGLERYQGHLGSDWDPITKNDHTGAMTAE